MRRVLLDENLPRLLCRHLAGFEVNTVSEMGWAGKRNGELLQDAAVEFDVLLTGDRGVQYQQDLSRIDLGVVVLGIGSTKLDDLVAVADRIRAAAQQVRSGGVVQVLPQ